MKIRISSSIFLLAITTSAFANAGTTESLSTLLGKIYIGAFGGGGSSNNFNASQYGTALYLEALGGPLAVNAFGQLESESSSFFGGQLGYQAQNILLTPSSPWTLGPAFELEGYSMNETSFTGFLSNNTERLNEHDFIVTYPMSRTIFLANMVLNFNFKNAPVHPYIGFGIGNAIIRISDADSTQVNPPEAGVNHYNSSSNDSDSTFAGQIKLGFSYDICKHISLFADYRWVYVGSTDFSFGSTVYPAHAQTTNWQVNLDDQRYNLGNIGVRLSL